jgi:transcriptional regulator with XRE-family HTH domain
MKNLKQILKDNRIKQCELADALGVTRATVNNWTRGVQQMPRKREQQVLDFLSKNNVAVKIQGDKITRKPDKSLEARIQECKKLALEQFGFEIEVIDQR